MAHIPSSSTRELGILRRVGKHACGDDRLVRRRDLLVGLGLAVSRPAFDALRSRPAVVPATDAQPILGTRRVAAWISDSHDAEASFTVFLARLSELGWQKGRNLEVAVVQWKGDLMAMRAQAEQLLASRRDVILAQSNQALAILRAKTGLVPTVFVMVADPVRSHLIDSLAHPGGNITGFTNFEPPMGGKWLEVLKESTGTLPRSGPHER